MAVLNTSAALTEKLPHLSPSFVAKLALNRHKVLDDDVIEVVSKGTCYRWGQRVVVKAEFRDD